MGRFLALILLTPALAFGQSKVYGHDALFGLTSACSTGGPNSTFTTAGGDGARHVTNALSFILPNGTLANRAVLEINARKSDDDSLIVLMSGVYSTDTTAVYIDTVYVPVVANKVSQVELSPSLTGSNSFWFPSNARFSIANEDSGANAAYPFFGVVQDTNVWYGRLIIWRDDGFSFNSKKKIHGWISDSLVQTQKYSDTLTSDATKSDIPDSADVRGWNFMNEDSSLYATQTDIASFITSAALSGYQQDSDTTTFDLTKTQAAASYQPLEATLTDIADGTISENLVNTANPWADNEVASSSTWNAKMDDSDSTTFNATKTDIRHEGTYQFFKGAASTSSKWYTMTDGSNMSATVGWCMPYAGYLTAVAQTTNVSAQTTPGTYFCRIMAYRGGLINGCATCMTQPQGSRFIMIGTPRATLLPIHSKLVTYSTVK